MNKTQRQEYDGFKSQLHRPLQVAPVTRDISAGEIEQWRKTRLGQGAFRTEVLRSYDSRCCFPGCDVDEPWLLIAAHIDRWADSEESRGKAENGLCLCALHDLAYEQGLFVIDDQLRVEIGSGRKSAWSKNNLAPFRGAKIRLGRVKPSGSLLRKHRKRHRKPTSRAAK